MWALDLGTTNSLVARWDGTHHQPALLSLPGIARPPSRDDAPGASRAVPSAVHIIDSPSLGARLGRRGLLARHFFLGELAHIGQEAVQRNAAIPRHSFVQSFKRPLAHAPLMPIARVRDRNVSAREVAWLFLRELLAEVKRQTGHRIRDLVVTHPIESFESYRAELVTIAKSLGVSRLRFLDEPLAAALGYGLGLQRARNVLVVDFGGGTLHMAVMHLEPRGASDGHAEVLSKAGRDIGGNLVDEWLLREFCKRLEFVGLDDDRHPEARLWRRLMLTEACRVKEALFFDNAASFAVTPPETLRAFRAQLQGEAPGVDFTREELIQLLDGNGLYRVLNKTLDAVLSVDRVRGGDDIEEVLLVGGSTLLPQVFSLFEQRFGRDRVRAWQPFEAVAFGACVFAAGQVAPADFIVHDYALLTHDRRTGATQHNVIIPRGTRFPTGPDFWKRQLVPTCALGEPERLFKLVVCEIGSSEGGRRFGWDAEGRLRMLTGSGQSGTEPIVVKLNESNPTLGTLDPPHPPSDTRPRLEVSFGVNSERWLVASVLDLLTRRHLLREQPVVRLL